MNNLVIPAILLATVMVAGMFAFMPVYQASTVHTTIVNDLQKLQVSAITNFAPTGDPPDTVTIHVLVTNSDGSQLTALELADFTVDGADVRETIDETVAAQSSSFTEIGNGVYQFIIDATDGALNTDGIYIVRIDVDPDTESTEIGSVFIGFSISP